MLTFETLCPLWYKVITTGKINRRLNMNDLQRCMVGEARLFNTLKITGCENCIRLGEQLYEVAPGKMRIKIKDRSRFDMLKNVLVQHIEKVHIDEHSGSSIESRS